MQDQSESIKKKGGFYKQDGETPLQGNGDGRSEGCTRNTVSLQLDVSHPIRVTETREKKNQIRKMGLASWTPAAIKTRADDENRGDRDGSEKRRNF